MHRSALSALFLATTIGLTACTSSSDDPAPSPATTSDAGTDGEAAPAADGGLPASDSGPISDGSLQVTLLADGTPYTVDTSKVKVDDADVTHRGVAIGEPLDLAAGTGRVTYNGDRGNTTPAYSVVVSLPGATSNSVYFFSTSGNFGTADATRTMTGTLTDIHLKFTATALQDGKVSHAFDVTIKGLDMN